MLHIPKTSEYFKYTREEQNLRNVTKLLHNFLTTPDEVEKYVEIMQLNYYNNCIHRYNVEILNIVDGELQLINNKSMIKNKLKELLSECRKFIVHDKNMDSNAPYR